MLKFIYETKEEIPKGLEGFYEEANGKFALQCEGAVPSSRLDEFRQNNLDLIKKNEELAGFQGMDLEEIKDLMAKKKEIEESKVKGDEEIKNLIEKRVEEMRTLHEQEIATRDQRIGTLEGNLSERIIDSALLEAGSELGLRSTAHFDVIARGRRVFKMENDQPVAYDEKGEKLFGADGQPLSTKDYMKKLVKEAEHLFEPSKGGGAGSNGGGGAGGVGGVNPWSKEGFNLTKQAAMLREDPNAAKQMAAQAGVPLKV